MPDSSGARGGAVVIEKDFDLQTHASRDEEKWTQIDSAVLHGK